MDTLEHGTLLLHALVDLLQDPALHHIRISLLHKFTYIPGMIVSVFSMHGTLFILHELLLHGYFCIPLHDYFLLLILILILLDMSVFGMRCVELSVMGVISRILHLLFPVSRYFVS